MCKFSMLAGDGYKRFGETMNQAVCNIIKRYSRFYGVLCEFEVSCLVYRIKNDADAFYQKIEDKLLDEFIKTHNHVKYDTIGKMRGYARRVGAFKSVEELRSETSYFFDDEVFDLWFNQTIEVNSEYRDTGKFYAKNGAHYVDGIFTAMQGHEYYYGRGCDADTENRYYCINYSKRELFKKIIHDVKEYIHDRGNDINTVKCCLCGGAKHGIEGFEKCSCEKMFSNYYWYERNSFTIGDAAEKLENFCIKKGIDINTLTPETRKEIGTTLALSFAVRKFKRKQSGDKKCK